MTCQASCSHLKPCHQSCFLVKVFSHWHNIILYQLLAWMWVDISERPLRVYIACLSEFCLTSFQILQKNICHCFRSILEATYIPLNREAEECLVHCPWDLSLPLGSRIAPGIYHCPWDLSLPLGSLTVTVTVTSLPFLLLFSRFHFFQGNSVVSWEEGLPRLRLFSENELQITK